MEGNHPGADEKKFLFSSRIDRARVRHAAVLPICLMSSRKTRSMPESD